MDLTQRFLDYLALEKNYSALTITSYKRDLDDFINFYQSEEDSTDIHLATKNHLRAFIMHLSELDKSERTVNRKLSALRSFYKFLIKEKNLTINPIEQIHSLKQNKQVLIPFTEAEVNARSKFKSNFMTDFINGKVKIENQNVDLFSQQETLSEFETLKGLSTRLQFSEEAKLVFDAGKNLWKYYHTQEFPSFRGVDSNAVGRRGVYNVNASLYDIREHFQGRNDKGKMKNKSDDETYMRLIAELRSALKILAKKIEPKVYEYGFLKE